MLWNYIRFDFGRSYFRDVTVLELIKEKLPVSISLGIWLTLLSYLISIPLGIRKAVKDGSAFDVWTSGVIIVAYALPGFLVAVLLIVLFAGGSFFAWFPLRGLTSENFAFMPWWQQILDYLWHMVLPIISLGLAAFATMTLLTKNSFLDEIRKQYVLTARAKGCSERQVLYGHVFRNAMLIVISGFPGAFVHAFFTGALLIEVIFSLDGIGLARFREHHQPRLSGGVRDALYLRPARHGRHAGFGPHLHLGRSAHRFREPGGLSGRSDRHPATAHHGVGTAAGRCPAAEAGLAVADQPAPLAELQGQPARLRLAVGFRGPVRAVDVRGIHRERPAADDPDSRAARISRCS